MAKVSLSGTGVLALAALAGGAYFFSKREEIAAAVNPFDERNLANRAANSLLEAATGSAPGSVTVGTWLYDMKAKYFPSATDDQVAEMLKTPENVQTLQGAEEQCAAGNRQVWIGLAALAFAVYAHSKNRRAHRG